MSSREPHRVAMLSLHTSPATQPGTGDAGGLNVYVLALAHALTHLGAHVDIFTRHNPDIALHPTPADAPGGSPHLLAPNLRIFEVTTGPENVTKQQLQQHVPEFVKNTLKVVGRHTVVPYTVVHGHYWLSGIAAMQLAETWNVPVVQTMHTLGQVKNAHLSPGDVPDPESRIVGEQQVLDRCSHIIANTDSEVADLRTYYGVLPEQVTVINPGVDTSLFYPTSPERRTALRSCRGLNPEDTHILFVGRLQPLKAPDVLLQSVAELFVRQSDLKSRVKITLNGDSSGLNGFTHQDLEIFARNLGIEEYVFFQKPQPRAELADTYRTADILAVPSYNETFGLVALEAAACGVPAVATNVGGLKTSIQHNHSGVLVDGHHPEDWAEALRSLIDDFDKRKLLSQNASEYAQKFSWQNAADKTLTIYDRTTTGT